MLTSVGLQYAKALYDLGVSSSNEINYLSELKEIKQVFDDSKDIYQLLAHPVLANEKKKEIINKSLKEFFSKTVIYFIYTLIDHNRILELDDIIDSYQSYLDEKLVCKDATVYMKYLLTDDSKEEITKNLESYFKQKLKINFVLDDNIIGGVVIKINGQILDCSIMNKLSNMQIALKKGW